LLKTRMIPHFPGTAARPVGQNETLRDFLSLFGDHLLY
jgi:hypothetical protein